MALTGRPTRKADLAKIDKIQEEFFGEEQLSEEKMKRKESLQEKSDLSAKISKNLQVLNPDQREDLPLVEVADENFPQNTGNTNRELEGLSIAELLSTTQVYGIRYSSRPYTVPRSLTIDLNRLKAKFKTKDLQYTQNELMDQMLKETLQIVTAENYHALRDKAYNFVKFPEQSSRRTVTLTEETVGEMAELKAALTLSQNKRISSDELFTSLLAIAFMPLYEKGLL